MNAVEFLNDTFGADWLQNIMSALNVLIALIVSLLWNKNKNKVNDITKASSKTVQGIFELLGALNGEVTTLENKNTKLEDTIFNQQIILNVLVDVVSIGFLDTRGITAEGKLAISQAIGRLSEIGTDTKYIDKFHERRRENNQQDFKEFIKAMGIVDQTVVSTTEEAAKTQAEALETYNEILEASKQ